MRGDTAFPTAKRADRGLAWPISTVHSGSWTTYVERDVRQVAAIGDLADLQRFMGLCAGRVGRLIKTPKLYFLDTGLACNLLGVTAAEQLRTHPLRRAIFENLVISELLKVWRHNGGRPRLYFWRDRTGREVDALLDFPGARVPLEAKAGETLSRSFFKGLGLCRAPQQEAGSPGGAAGGFVGGPKAVTRYAAAGSRVREAVGGRDIDVRRVQR